MQKFSPLCRYDEFLDDEAKIVAGAGENGAAVQLEGAEAVEAERRIASEAFNIIGKKHALKKYDQFAFGEVPNQEPKHLRLCHNITSKPLPQYLQQGFHPKRSLQEILK